MPKGCFDFVVTGIRVYANNRVWTLRGASRRCFSPWISPPNSMLGFEVYTLTPLFSKMARRSERDGCYDLIMFNFGRPQTAGDWIVHFLGAVVALFLIWWMIWVFA